MAGNTWLTVTVTDPDGTPMDVTFYDNASGDPIGSVTGVFSGDTASVTWSGLQPETDYEWYVVVDDGVDTVISEVWSFTTQGDAVAVPAMNIAGILATAMGLLLAGVLWNRRRHV